jgi:hypothetical protein
MSRTVIDWQSLKTLPRVRWETDRDPEKLSKPRRKHGKRHSVNRERSREESAKAAKGRLRAQASNNEAAVYKAAVRAYWRGEREGHPDQEAF